MFGTMKKAMVVMAIAGVAAAAPAVASADQWMSGGSAYSGPAHAEGRLTLTLQANGATTTCDVTAGLSLSNPGGVAAGTVNSFVLGSAVTGNPCVTSLEGCTVTATAAPASLPWTIDTSATSVTITNVNFTNVYSGASCAIGGSTVTATGSVTGTASGDTITFTNAGPLTTGFGPATVSGSVTTTTAPGGAQVSLG